MPVFIKSGVDVSTENTVPGWISDVVVIGSSVGHLTQGAAAGIAEVILSFLPETFVRSDYARDGLSSLPGCLTTG